MEQEIWVRVSRCFYIIFLSHINNSFLRNRGELHTLCLCCLQLAWMILAAFSLSLCCLVSLLFFLTFSWPPSLSPSSSLSVRLVLPGLSSWSPPVVALRDESSACACFILSSSRVWIFVHNCSNSCLRNTHESNTYTWK